ncbi:uncharacterized protein TRAVEDRAFT_63605 [Trametes versicolor FP-101664 SS1]|uniref:uncharacterized protein n=1 Tax=Trametes versicolor (strain FP-101664) TaxID=717944 RepID=UPI0004623A9E|nr:uncharacterized protein TRAVEDRAFT_63605 [Trametes versicolor FP-101664 SS1]EIW62176.1 hypothetical protein TRAVEDRAFT_63605 [Trametes versicolor FP-101664 SS1]
MVFSTSTSTITTRASASTSMYPAATTAPAPGPPRSIDLASQVDPATHDRRIVEMIHMKIEYGVFDYLLDTIVLTVASAMIGPTARVALQLKGLRLTTAVRALIEFGGITMPAILATLVYLERVRPHLQIDVEDWVCERIAIGALVTAQKYIVDHHIGASRWASASAMFTKADINRMEREFLALLNFEMRINEEDLLAHYDGLRRAVRRCADSTPPNGTVFTRREIKEHHYTMHSHIHTPVAEPPFDPTAPCYLPDLQYPDSPSSNDSSPPVITPPDAHPYRGAKRYSHSHSREHSYTSNPYVAAQPYPTPRERGLLQHDRQMEARARWYAAAPTPRSTRPSPYGPRTSSPRFEPFSPPTARYERPQHEHTVGSRESRSPWRRHKLADHDPLGFYKQR